MVNAKRAAANGLAKTDSIRTAISASPSPRPSASPGSISPLGTGRLRVRAMTASMSASHHMFSAPEAPAPTAMQIRLASATTGCMYAGAAIMPASAVKTTSDMTRGFNSTTKSRNSGSAARVRLAWAEEMSVKAVPLLYLVAASLVGLPSIAAVCSATQASYSS